LTTYLKQPRESPPGSTEAVRQVVSEILLAVEREGMPAVRRYSERFDGWSPQTIRVSPAVANQAVASLTDELREAILFAIQQVRGFAQLQRKTLTEFEAETLPGVRLGQRHIPVAAVGSYSPGGRYPMLASSVMTVVVPKVAEVPRVVACAPPSHGQGIHPPQLAAMSLSGADEVICVGGVQALAAMAFGVDDLEPVDMLVGAGNAYVAEAKRQLFGVVGIDLLAGPTEILVLADETADPELCACDLLGQAEHGPTSPAGLLTTSEKLAAAVEAEVERLLRSWPTADVTRQAWEACGSIILCDSDDEMVSVANALAYEHVEVQTADPRWFLDRLSCYGSLFVGAHATVAYGDKGIGTNHVLPTARAARYTGGLWVGKFLRTVTYQIVDAEATDVVAPPIAAICDAENMLGHAITARIRLNRADAISHRST
jgi:sulfopropanediol 3-dehydrogenase